MPRRSILTARQRSALFDLPTDEAAILHHYTLADNDIEHIRTRRQSRNRLGFALQLCAHILLTGEYRAKTAVAAPYDTILPPTGTDPCVRAS